MADPRQLKIVAEGVKAWNRWREKRRSVIPDLSGANLGEVLRRPLLKRIRKAYLDRVSIFGNPDETTFDLFYGLQKKPFPDLQGVNFSEAILWGVNLSSASLCDANLKDAQLQRADLRGTLLTNAELSQANFRDANLNSAQLNAARCYLTDFGGANLERAYLHSAKLVGAKLNGTNLRQADLGSVDLSHAALIGADLRGTDLSYVDFTGATLSEAMFDDATLNGTILADVDLSQVQGLDTVRHNGPSKITISVMSLSKGRIPDSFLRGAGVPDPYITNMQSLVAAMSPIQFYSCFISYSHKDENFVERLYADLRAQNVRCWYAPKDMKIGTRIRQEIDDAIRLYDKLLVVLSETSVASAWVESEVESALERERTGKGEQVLFPIRVDDSVMKTRTAWAADIRRTRHMGDFTNWLDRQSYQKAVHRLLRDLQGGKD